MNLSIFYRLMPNKNYELIVNSNKSKFLVNLNFYISHGPLRLAKEKRIFYGKIKNGKFNLTISQILFNFKKIIRYNIIGEVKEVNDKSILYYKFNLIMFNLKHFTICILPIIFYLYIGDLPLFIPLIYFLITDFIINLIKVTKQNKFNNHFVSFINKIL